MPQIDVREEYRTKEALFAAVLAAIRLHGDDLLAIPGVVSVQPGFRIVRGRVTTIPAVQVTVLKKLDLTALDSRTLLPRRLGKAMVDVVLADPLEQLRLSDSMSAGPGITSDWRLTTLLPGDSDAEDAAAGQPIPYVPPDQPLEEVDEEMTVVCHSSVDSGWRLLSAFFGQTEASLVSTMYEFTAPYIMDRLVESLEAPRTFEFIFDGKNKAISPGDLTQQEVTSRLETKLNSRLTFAWAANASARQVTAGFFPTAYHIKVSVRDGKETWLSSGNWKPSGQPEDDPFAPPVGFNASIFQRSHNREWHVLLRNKNLSKQFQRFIRYDIEQALPLQAAAGPAPPPPVMPDLFVPIGDDALAGPPAFFKEKTRTAKLRVMPLLTPDNGSYFDFVKDKIAGATSKIYFENQSLAPNKNDSAYMNELFLVLRDKSRDENMDVKIIVRGDFGPAKILSALQMWEFRMDRVRLLKGVHTKGILIDDEMVLLGSHNWTSQGARLNRDASVAFWDPEIVAYYNDMFEYDWNRAPKAIDDSSGPTIAAPGAPVPPGHIRVPWTSVFDDPG
jgi:hypothetical protein